MTDRPKFRTYGETPLDELRQTISFAIWHAADREMGSQQMLPCTHDSCEAQPPLDFEEWKREQHDPEHKKRRHLVALRLAADVGQSLSGWAYNAHETGKASWAEIGEVLGVSKQAAWERFGGKFGQPASEEGAVERVRAFVDGFAERGGGKLDPGDELWIMCIRRELDGPQTHESRPDLP